MLCLTDRVDVCYVVDKVSLAQINRNLAVGRTLLEDPVIGERERVLLVPLNCVDGTPDQTHLVACRLELPSSTSGSGDGEGLFFGLDMVCVAGSVALCSLFALSFHCGLL